MTNRSETGRALGVVWTTPLVAALGVSLTIPLAMVADMVLHGQRYSAIYIIGSAQVNERSHQLLVPYCNIEQGQTQYINLVVADLHTTNII